MWWTLHVIMLWCTQKVCCIHKIWVQNMQCQSVVKLVSLTSRLEGLVCTHSGTASLRLLYNSNQLHGATQAGEECLGKSARLRWETCAKKHLELTTHYLVASSVSSVKLLSPNCCLHFCFQVSRVYLAPCTFEHKRCGLILFQICVFESFSFYPSYWNTLANSSPRRSVASLSDLKKDMLLLLWLFFFFTTVMVLTTTFFFSF